MYATPQMLPQQQQGMPAYRKWAIWISILIHLAVLGMCLGARELGSNGTVDFLMGLGLTCLSSCLAFYVSNSRVLHFLSSFLVATFTLKVPLCLFMPMDTYLEVLKIDSSALGPLTAEAYAKFSVGFLVLVLTSIALPYIFPWQEKKQLVQGQLIPAPSNVFTIVGIACIGVIGLHFTNIYVLQIGGLGETPREILFPGFTGLLKFTSTTGAIALLSSFLALALTRRKFSSFAIAMGMFMAYLALDLSIGKKRVMFVIALSLTWLIVFLEDRRLQSRLKPLVPLFLGGALLLYGPVMTLRHSLIKGKIEHTDVFSELFSSDVYSAQTFGKVVNKIVNRFNGLDLLAVTCIEFEGEPLGPSYLLSGEFSLIFAYQVMGVPEDVVIGMGSTLWGFFYSVLGNNWLLVCGSLPCVVHLCRRENMQFGWSLS